MERQLMLVQASSDRLGQLVRDFLQYEGDFLRHSPATVRAYRGELLSFIRFLRGSGVAEPEQVGRETVMAWASSGGRKFAPATIRRRVATLGAFWRYLRTIGVTAANPTQGIPLPRVEPQVPRLASPEDLQALLAATRQSWEFCAMTLLATCGLRRAELTGLRLGDVDLAGMNLLVMGKGARERRLPLPALAADAIRLYLPSRRPRRDTDRLLVTQRGCIMGKNTIWQMVRRLAKRAGIQAPLSPHWMRHSYATGLLRSGADVRDVMELLGHADLASTSRYLHASPDRQRAAVEALAAGLRG